MEADPVVFCLWKQKFALEKKKVTTKQPPQKDWWWKCAMRVLSKSSLYVPLKEEAAHTLDGSSRVVLEGRAAGAFPVRTSKHP